jgi:manganese-dependent inorganic pyrophosphatase
MDTIYITGHRNPDTDSIVSAMAYAALKNALGQREYQAARLGQISDETQMVLDYFGVQPPQLITNVRTQVRDLDYDTPPTLSPAATLSRAWQIMQADRISVLPVVNEDGTLYGMLSAGDVANYDMRSVRDPVVGRVPIYNLLSVLEGKIINTASGGQLRDEISGEIVITLPTCQENLLFSSPDTIVVCGDQPEMIRRALEIGVNCVIVCQAEVPMELRDLETEACIISTPFDPYRAVRLIWHALPISHVCKNASLVSFHLDDYIDDVKNTVLESRFRAYPILDENEKVVGTLSRYHLLRPRRKRVILMDHNERAQSVPGLEQARILEIVDHHRLADIETGDPIYVRNEPVGSTNTIVAGMYQEKGLMPSAKMAGLMAAAIVSDTVMFKSPTCTQRDIDVANRMARIANVSLETLGKTIFSASSGDAKDVETILKTDYKEFHIAGHDLAVSQITCMDSERLLDRKAEFLKVMQELRKKRKFDLVVLMITDVLMDGSQLLFAGDEETIRQAFHVEGDMDHSVFLPKIMSRKKQVIPMLSALWG